MDDKSLDVKQSNPALIQPGENEVRFRVLFEQAAVGVNEANARTGKFIRANNSYCAMLGYNPEELQDANFTDLTHPDDVKADLEYMEQILAGTIKQFSVDKRYIRKDGSIMWANLTLSALWEPGDEPTNVMGVIIDISERKKNEEILRENEAIFRTVFEDSVIGKSITQLDGTIQVNKAMCDMLGYTKEEMKAKWQDITYPDDINLTRQYMQDLVESKYEKAFFEKRFIHKSGSIVWTNITSVLHRDANGKPAYFITSLSDITQKKQSEAELYKLNRSYAVISQTSQMLVRTRDKEQLFPEICRIAIEYGQYFMAWIGIVEEAGHQVQPVAWNGFETSYIENLNISLLDEPVTQEPIGAALRAKNWFCSNDIENDARPGIWKDDALWRGFRSTISLPIIIRDKVIGVFSLYSTQASYFNDAEIKLLSEVASDIAYAIDMIDTEESRQRAEARLLVANERLETAEEYARLGYWGYDLTQQQGYWSKQMFRLFDLEPGEQHPSWEEFQKYIHPEDRIILQTAFESIQSGQHLNNRIRTNPEICSLRHFQAAFRIEKQPINYGKKIEGILLDISDRVEAENEIRLLNETLEQKVMARTAELTAANKELEAFSYSVSHDLRSPLRAINGFSTIIQEDYFDKLDEVAMNYLNKIKENARHMGELTDALQSLAKTQLVVLHKEHFNVSIMAEAIAGKLMEEQPDRKVIFRIKEDMHVFGDKILMEIALTNLMGNAFKFTSQKEQADIEFGYHLEHRKPVYFIKDNGVGFDMTAATKLFGAFQRLHSSKEFPGTGIGLATVQRIMQRHGGSIRAESKPDAGTTFFFTMWDYEQAKG